MPPERRLRDVGAQRSSRPLQTREFGSYRLFVATVVEYRETWEVPRSGLISFSSRQNGRQPKFGVKTAGGESISEDGSALLIQFPGVEQRDKSDDRTEGA